MRPSILSSLLIVAVAGLAYDAGAADDGCCASTTQHAKGCVGECGLCPITGAARAAGAEKAAILKLAKARNAWIAEWNKATTAPEYKTAMKEHAEEKAKGMLKPATDAFHKEAKTILGEKIYAEFAKKLPDWAKA